MLLVILIFNMRAYASLPDTVLINASNVMPSAIKEGTNRYLVYFKTGDNGTRGRTQFWTRKVERGQYHGKKVITISQEWEDKDTIMHKARSICDAISMKPLFHNFWWNPNDSSSIDFEAEKLAENGISLSDQDTAKHNKEVMQAFLNANKHYFLNWHIDLEVFSILPYKDGVTFLIPFYEPGFAAPLENIPYSVEGSTWLSGYDDQQIECWRLKHESKGNREIFWISKKTKEVLKLEQEIKGKKGTLHRYKIKLGFSI